MTQAQHKHSGEKSAQQIDELEAVLDDALTGSIDESQAQDRLPDGVDTQKAIEEMEEIDADADEDEVFKKQEQASSFNKDEPDSLLDEVDPAPPSGD